VIDDGIATGNTLMATVNVLRKSNPGKIVIGVPVASKSAVQKLSKEVDEVVAVIGYGVQGPGQALNQKDNGINVICWPA